MFVKINNFLPVVAELKPKFGSELVFHFSIHGTGDKVLVVVDLDAQVARNGRIRSRRVGFVQVFVWTNRLHGAVIQLRIAGKHFILMFGFFRAVILACFGVFVFEMIQTKMNGLDLVNVNHFIVRQTIWIN